MAPNVHEVIYKYNLPITRDSQSVHECLRDYYKGFLTELKESFSLATKNDFPDSFYVKLKETLFPEIKKQCNLILGITKLNHGYLRTQRYELFDALMKSLIESKAFRYLPINKDDPIVRIRSGSGPFERKDLFHIPYDRREITSHQRFSDLGDSCLYLSIYPGLKYFSDDMIYLSWLESGMPKTFYFSLFEVQNKLTCLHLAKQGSTYLKEYDEANTQERKADRLEAIEQYLLTFPLRAAISMSVEDKFVEDGINYYEEYEFPQLLIQWLQENSSFDGLTYQSAKKIPDANNCTSYNAVFPAKNIDRTTGYDENLKKAFKLSPPKKVDFYTKVKALDNNINEVRQYARELKLKLTKYHSTEVHPYYNLLSVCYSFDSICSSIKNVNETHMRNSFQQLNTLWRMALLIFKTIENAKTADQWIALYKRYTGDTALTENDYQDVLLKFEIVVNALVTLKSLITINEMTQYVFSRPDYQFID